MNKIIAEQLDKCNISYDDTTTEIFIPSTSVVVDELIVNHYYKIQVESYIVNPPETFTLAANWNNGTSPKDYILNCEILQVMGKMVKVNSVGVGSNNVWEGWLPRKSFKIIEEIR